MLTLELEGIFSFNYFQKNIAEIEKKKINKENTLKQTYALTT